MKRPPYLLREKTRHGKVVWYFRKGDGPRIRIRGDYGSKEFLQAYSAALSGETAIVIEQRDKQSFDSLPWLVRLYRESPAWSKLSAATRNTREGLLRHLESVDRLYASITRKDIIAAINNREGSMQAHFLKTARGLFRWAIATDLIEVDPTEGVRVKSQKTEGYHTWTEEEVVAFERHWPIGTRERLAMALMLYTGVRRGDAVQIGRQHIKDGLITLKTEKTGAHVYLPMAAELSEVIEATNTGTLSLICKADGSPMNKRYFGQWFKDACVKAGVPGSCHGLRKAGATRLAEAGATLHELNAVFGWVGSDMASLYTRESDRKRLAASAMAKLKANKE